MNEDEIIGFGALYESMDKCRRGVMWKDSVARYYLNGIEETLKLENQLKTGTYKAKEPIKFKVTHPKERDITSIAFRDRVYQRSLNDKVLYPVITKSFIYDNMACQKDKGTDLARERLKKFLREAYRRHGLNLYVLQVDVKGCYRNMQHAVVYKQFSRKLDEWSYTRTADILSGQYAGETGFDPGSQMVQIAGVAFLDELDHYIKERLHIKWYLRYMDDFILIHPSADYLLECKQAITKKLADIGMYPHPDKTRVYTIRAGIKFLGFIFRISETGKVTMMLKPENVKAERKKLRRLVNHMPKAKADESYQGWRAHAAKGDSTTLLMNMDEYYKDLWRQKNEQLCKTVQEIL